MPTLYVNDVIQFRPNGGIARIATITGLGPDGFIGVITADRTQPVVGRYEQVLRVMRRADPDLDHKTRTVGIGDDWVAWICRCGENDLGRGEDTEDAMRNARVQQEMHRRNIRSDD
jgi:hypothetical protein